ncbi:hypothetical protein AGMMS49928_28740 [Spirochaetia bacterium]|nr:hypothetical protein AGMMS49928_28740 [Spirochaetia bacterium]
MRGIVRKIVFLPFLIIVLAGCGSSPKVESPSGEGKSLDTAIQEAAVQMETNLPGQTKVALVSVASSSAQLSEYVISRLEAALVGGKKLIVVDRANLDRIREEQGFQLSGEVSDESAKAIGQLLGAGAIVTGSFTDLGDVYSLTLKAINMETAAVAVSYPADVARSTRIQTMLASGGGAAGTQTARAKPASVVVETPAVPAAPPEPVYEKEYKVGDRGPAGGWIFYDKGRVTNGWRYLEAAPSETEFTAAWGMKNETVGGTGTGIGAGKRNGEILVKYLDGKREIGGLAQVCTDLFIGGFDGWFLPSKDELDLMYKNLKVKRIGGFGDSVYFSSSEIDGYAAWVQRFGDGRQENAWFNGADKEQARLVRAIRQF